MTRSAVPLYFASAADFALSASAPVAGVPNPGGGWAPPRANGAAADAFELPPEFELPTAYAPNASATAAMPATANVMGLGVVIGSLLWSIGSRRSIVRPAGRPDRKT